MATANDKVCKHICYSKTEAELRQLGYRSVTARAEDIHLCHEIAL